MARLTMTMAALIAFMAGAAQAARAPTYVEKVTIMDAFNIPGRAWPSECVRIEVSTVDPRWAYVTSPAHPPAACLKAGEVGNGFVIVRRASRTSLHWKHVEETGEGVPCVFPLPVRKDFFGTTKCGDIYPHRP